MPEEVEMGEIQIHFPDINKVREISNDDDSQVPNQPQETKRPRISRRLSRRERGTSRPLEREKPTTLSHIMGTVFPNLTSKQRVILVLGILSSLTHASATPIFSFCLSKLFTTFYAGSDSARLSMIWSLAVLGVSFGDGLASFFMHYFLEFSGEAWMDTIRNRAFKRILDQPRAWFENDGNSASRLTAFLDQNGEDMRNLLGRFAGYVIVAASITVMAIIWSLLMCWKLTLVAIACGPFIYAITRGFEATNGLWERRTNAANSVVFDIFTETFSEIRTVRTLTLEGYFHHKHTQAMSRSLTIGLKRAVYTGMLFGMVESTVIFANGKIISVVLFIHSFPDISLTQSLARVALLLWRSTRGL
jgi:ATP-binding cassette subfamily B (MDR/TAP) protein 1